MAYGFRSYSSAPYAGVPADLTLGLPVVFIAMVTVTDAIVNTATLSDNTVTTE